MVVQTIIHDGTEVQTRIYRNITRGVNLAELREGFLAQRAYNKWGKMIQLKGNDRIVLARFGKEEQND